MSTTNEHITDLRHQLSDILVTVPYGIITVSEAGLVTTINSIAARLLDVDEVKLVDLVDKPIDEVAKKIPDILIAYNRLTGRTRERSIYLPELSYQNRFLDVRLKKMLHGGLICVEDRTEMLRLQNQLAHRASHDQLTQLFNRHEFFKRVEDRLQRINSSRGPAVLAYIDLDRLKPINDMEGHKAGDAVIEYISETLRRLTRERDSVGRLGGDEFAVLMENCSLEDGLTAFNKIRSEVAGHRFLFDDTSYRVSLSIGIVELTEAFTTAEDLVNAADQSCLTAKSNGRDRVEVHTSDTRDLEALRNDAGWLPRIDSALEENRFVFYQQEIRNVGADGSSSCEILLRLKENGQLVSPMAFIPQAERFDKMESIDRLVIEGVFRRARPGRRYFINLSGQTLSSQELVPFLEEMLQKFNIDANQFVFEVTETAAIRNITVAETVFEFLKNRGFSIALDDFGSGLSSFAYIRDLPVDYIKIDGSFVTGLLDDPVYLEIIRAVIQICHALDFGCIAEHVENDAVYSRLVDLGIDYVQGYAIGVPTELESEAPTQ